MASVTLMARPVRIGIRKITHGREISTGLRGTELERVTGIEPALSAWESVPSGPVTWSDLRDDVPVSDRRRPLVTEVYGPLMARRSWPRIIAVLSVLHPSGVVRRSTKEYALGA